MSTPDEGRYSRVSRRIWNDERFRELSQPKPSGAWLFFRLLTGPELSCIPGLFQAWDGGLARALRWSLKDLERCWKEIADKKLAFADWDAGLVWLPNSIHHNEPANPNVILGWRTAWTELPECRLKTEAEAVLREWCEARGESWLKAFDEVVGREPRKGKAKGSLKGSPKQDQEQDKEPEQEKQPAAVDPKDQKPSAPAPPPPPAAAAASPVDFDKPIPCPPDLKLTDDQFNALNGLIGIDRESADLLTATFVGKSVAPGVAPRSLSKWLGCLSTAITGKWNAGERPLRQARGTSKAGPTTFERLRIQAQREEAEERAQEANAGK